MRWFACKPPLFLSYLLLKKNKLYDAKKSILLSKKPYFKAGYYVYLIPLLYLYS